MKCGEQSNAFMVIVYDPSIEITQEHQVNEMVENIGQGMRENEKLLELVEQ